VETCTSTQNGIMKGRKTTRDKKSGKTTSRSQINYQEVQKRGGGGLLNSRFDKGNNVSEGVTRLTKLREGSGGTMKKGGRETKREKCDESFYAEKGSDW